MAGFSPLHVDNEQKNSYIVNTTQEDQKVVKTLSGWPHEQDAKVPNYSKFGSIVLKRVLALQDKLFCHAHGYSAATIVRDDAMRVSTASIIMCYPEMEELRSNSPYVAKVKIKMTAVGVGDNEMRAWSLTVRASLIQELETGGLATPASSDVDAFLKEQGELMRILVEQNKILLNQNKALLLRVERIERELQYPASHLGSARTSIHPTSTTDLQLGSAGIFFDLGTAQTEESASEPSNEPVKKRKRKSSSKSLRAVWCEWFGDEPWSTHKNRQRYHEMKFAVAYMKMFLPQRFDPLASGSVSKSKVLETGTAAEANALAFLRAHGFNGKGYGLVVSNLKRLHQEGKLNDCITNFKDLALRGRIVDPAPESAHH